MPVETIAGILLSVGLALSDKQLKTWLKDKSQRKAFRNALDAALQEMVEAGHKVKRPGAVDKSLLKSEVVQNELWAKLLDPSIDEGINYDLLLQELEDVYENLTGGAEERAALECFVDALYRSIRQEPELAQLIQTKIIFGLSTQLAPEEERRLIRDYLVKETERIKNRLQQDMGEGVTYVEPIIEKRIGVAEKRMMPSPRRPKMDDLPGGDQYESERAETIDINTYFIAGHNAKAAVVADSGYGKTTLLRELFLRMINAYTLKKQAIPILWGPGDAEACTKDTVVDRIIEPLWLHGGVEKDKVKAFVEDQFHKGNFVFLIDALDQITDRNALVGCFASDAFGNNTVVLTSRPDAYDQHKGHLRDYEFLQIEKFDDDRMQDYLGEDKLSRLRDIVDEEFLAVPILLKLVAEHWVERADDDLPVTNRARLYDGMFTDLLDRQELVDALRAAGHTNADRRSLRHDLRRLSYHTIAAGHLGQFPWEIGKNILGDGKLEALETCGGFLVILEMGHMTAFRHRSFQEFLAAEYFHEYLKNHHYNFDLIESHIYHPDWEDTLRFLAGMLSGDKAKLLVEKLMHASEEMPLTLYRHHLRLAAVCLHEMGDIGQELRDGILRQCHDHLKTPYLVDSAMTVMIALRAVDPLITLMLAETTDDSVRWSAADALGAIKSERAVDPLITLMLAETTSDDVRWSAAYALGEMDSSEALSRMVAAYRESRSPEIREYLLSAIQSCDTAIRRRQELTPLRD